MLALVDATDAAGFSGLFAPQGHMRFANNEAMTGPEAIEAGVKGFFTSVKGLSHPIVNEWNDGADTIVELAVDYFRLDGQNVTIPVVSIWHLDEAGLIDDYRVFFDIAPVFA